MRYRYIATWPLEWKTPDGYRAAGYGEEIAGMEPAMLQRKLDCGHARREEVPEEDLPSKAMTKRKLAEFARMAGLDTTGTKADLLARLQSAEQQNP